MELFGQYHLDPSSSSSRKNSSSSSKNSWSISSPSSSSSSLDHQQAAADQPPRNLPSREYMFEKAMTPSDVGKLNRLVIPKQYAEKFFPLDPSSASRGLILSFEDHTCRSSKQWRFRYSYWSSSQSYVMTRGWSRFVKEKQLRAGDTVTFCRSAVADGEGPGQAHNYLIDWHRCKQSARPKLLHSIRYPQTTGKITTLGHNRGGQAVFSGLLPPTYSTSAAVALNLGAAARSSQDCFTLVQHEQIRLGHSSTTRAIGLPSMDLGSTPVAHPAAEERRSILRLFGVNLEASHSI